MLSLTIVFLMPRFYTTKKDGMVPLVPVLEPNDKSFTATDRYVETSSVTTIHS
jgi:hypothetical protein